MTFCRWRIWSLGFVGFGCGSMGICKFSCEISFVVWSLKATEGRRDSARISAKRWPVRGFFFEVKLMMRCSDLTPEFSAIRDRDPDCDVTPSWAMPNMSR